MKVLHVSSAHMYGGIETILVSLARHRNLCPGMEHHFAICFEGRLGDELRALNVPLYLLGEVRLKRPFSILRARRALVSALERSGCEAVICHGPRSMIFFAPAVRDSGKPLVMWVHGVKAGRHWLMSLLKRTPPDLLVCNSQYTQDAVTALFPAVGSKVVYAPVDPASTRFDQTTRAKVRQELGAAANAIVIVQAGRMVPLKGQGLLIESLIDVRAEQSWHCWIVGGAQTRSEKAYMGKLVSRVKEAGLTDRIHFTGQRDDVPGIFAAADICCQPNLRGESFGVVFVEAMMAGLPVVTSDLGAAIEILGQQSGIVVPANDQQALTKALGDLLVDPGLRHRLGAFGLPRARQLCDPAARMQDLKTALDALDSARQLPSNE